MSDSRNVYIALAQKTESDNELNKRFAEHVESNKIIYKFSYRIGKFLFGLEVFYIIFLLIFGISVAINVPAGLIDVVINGFHSAALIYVSMVNGFTANPESPEKYITRWEYTTRIGTATTFVVIDLIVLFKHILYSSIPHDYDTYHVIIVIFSSATFASSIFIFLWSLFFYDRVRSRYFYIMTKMKKEDEMKKEYEEILLKNISNQQQTQPQYYNTKNSNRTGYSGVL